MKVRIDEIGAICRRSLPFLTETRIEGCNLLCFRGDSVFATDGTKFIVFSKNPIAGLGIDAGFDGQLLSQFASSMPKDCEVEAEAGEDSIAFSHGGSRAVFPLVKSNIELDVPDGIEWRDIDGGFKDAVEFCAKILMEDCIEPYNGICRIADGHAWGTDQLTVRRADVASIGSCAPFFIPKGICDIISAGGITGIGLTEDRIFCRGDGFVAGSRLPIVDSYPDLEGVVGKCAGGSRVEFPNGMVEALRRASIFCEGKNRQDRKVLIRVAKGQIQIRAKQMRGSYADSIPLGMANPPRLAFSMNPDDLADLIGKAEGISVGDDFFRAEWNGRLLLASLMD